MKKEYKEPVINISYFQTENIVTVSGVSLADDALTESGATDIQKMDLAGNQVKKVKITW